MNAILTAAEMRAAEARAIAAGTDAYDLMQRAGAAAVHAILLYAGPMPALVLCGPGNNGGDGYVIARLLAERGVDVRVVALGDPVTDAAKQARAYWSGPVQSLDTEPAPLLIDALFGTGLSRPIDAAVADRLNILASAAKVKVAIDLPSGAATDDGAILSPLPDYDLTITFGALKPSHLLQPAARHMGRIVVADIGIDARSNLHMVERPALPGGGPDDHKYRRGMVLVVGGSMPGAASLAAQAAARSGSGYVALRAPDRIEGLPAAIVQHPPVELREKARATLIGPGLGREQGAQNMLAEAFENRTPLVLDGDALALVSPEQVAALPETPILTPHEGEFVRMFGTIAGSKVDRARAAAERAKAAIVYKGADTIIAAPDGRAAIAAPPAWLATAGTGDVLAGIVVAMRARGLDPFAAACAGVWLHSRVAQLAGPALIADDLLPHLPVALAECR